LLIRDATAIIEAVAPHEATDPFPEMKIMAIRVTLPAALAICLGFAPAVEAGSTSPLVELTNVVAHAAGADALFIDAFFGADTTKSFDFTYSIDTAGHTWSYSLVPGQTYLGQPIAVALASTSYDPTTTTYQWSETGQIGSQSWTAAGTIAGDPDLHDSFLAPDGSRYKVDGTYNTVGNETMDDVTVTGPNGENLGTGHSTLTIDTEGHWIWHINIVPPKGPITTIIFNAQTDRGTITISESVPEPSSLGLAVTAALAGLGWWSRRGRVAVR
jgi:hypothetical protein